MQLALITNTDERVAELVTEIEAVLAEGILTRRDGERQGGRLQFASRQLFGRTFRNHLRKLSVHTKMGRRVLSEATVNSLSSIKEALKLNVPRKVSSRMADFIHAYADALLKRMDTVELGELRTHPPVIAWVSSVSK